MTLGDLSYLRFGVVLLELRVIHFPDGASQ